MLFLDVDGPFIPLGGTPVDHGHDNTAHPLLDRLDPALGPALLGLGRDLLWATTWGEDANTLLCPLLGLPRLPVVTWPDGPDDGVDRWFGLHWKTRTLVGHAAGRAFVWVDDEITDADRTWVADNHPGPGLPYRVDPARGLSLEDVDHIADWLRTEA
ncbi:HAD domain-containing protein [Saccharothrix violaceirubra]|uniref:Secreted protein n=1 Tax=Saccharothrix violaceirubra TaxID=413306 RepID=A0A7W7WX27_9PSEU|nr:hypothetical protein [Saccharothrix violaceirubra]MBB4966183.1 hypothetical protein [Saccharothrix violaceirubra]